MINIRARNKIIAGKYQEFRFKIKLGRLYLCCLENELIFDSSTVHSVLEMAYKFWICKERKTDLFEIIFLCVEAVILSIVGELHEIQGMGVFLFVYFEETALFLLNYIVKYVASVLFGEAEESYY